MLRRLLLLAAVVGGPVALLVDRRLRSRRGGGAFQPMRMLVVIDAPVEATWAIVSDIALQPEWMHEMKAVTMETPGPARAGARGTALVRIAGISVSDPVEISAVEAPRRFAIRHLGLFTGGGEITLEPAADGAATVVRWEETLVPPFLPDLGSLVQAPILRSIFQADLLRLKHLVERGGVA